MYSLVCSTKNLGTNPFQSLSEHILSRCNQIFQFQLSRNRKKKSIKKRFAIFVERETDFYRVCVCVCVYITKLERNEKSYRKSDIERVLTCDPYCQTFSFNKCTTKFSIVRLIVLESSDWWYFWAVFILLSNQSN